MTPADRNTDEAVAGALLGHTLVRTYCMLDRLIQRSR